jgi:hypothetical protein
MAMERRDSASGSAEAVGEGFAGWRAAGFDGVAAGFEVSVCA